MNMLLLLFLTPPSLSLSSVDGRCPSVPVPILPHRTLHSLRHPQAFHRALWKVAGFLRLVQKSPEASAETVALSSTLTKQNISNTNHWAKTCSSTSSRWLSHFSSSATVVRETPSSLSSVFTWSSRNQSESRKNQSINQLAIVHVHVFARWCWH